MLRVLVRNWIGLSDDCLILDQQVRSCCQFPDPAGSSSIRFLSRIALKRLQGRKLRARELLATKAVRLALRAVVASSVARGSACGQQVDFLRTVTSYRKDTDLSHVFRQQQRSTTRLQPRPNRGDRSISRCWAAWMPWIHVGRSTRPLRHLGGSPAGRRMPERTDCWLVVGDQGDGRKIPVWVVRATWEGGSDVRSGGECWASPARAAIAAGGSCPR